MGFIDKTDNKNINIFNRYIFSFSKFMKRACCEQGTLKLMSIISKRKYNTNKTDENRVKSSMHKEKIVVTDS